MSSRKAQPPALSIRTSSTESSPRCSSAYEESEADDEGNMTMAEYIPTRPLTVAIPKGYVSGPYCPRRPNLSEILANTAPPPWTLPAFMAYLSQNHCLETLEFTMDASRYRKHYSKWANRSPGSPVSPLSDECTYVKMLWQRLLDAYIVPNGPREVNLPSDVRDTLLSLSNPYVPPHPSTLDPAVSKIYELMEESVLVPFLNSICPQTAHPDSSCDNNDEGLIRSQTRSYDDRAMYGRFTASPQNMSASVPGPYYRASAPSSLTSNFTQTRSFVHTRFASGSAAASSSPFARMTPGSYGSGSDVLTDDSGSASSPSAIDDLMTPPTTPPVSEYNYGNYYEANNANGANGNANGGTPSPRSSRGEHGMGIAGATKDGWKRVSSKLWPKKRSRGALREEEQGAVEGGLF